MNCGFSTPALEREIAECNRRIDALHLQIALAGDEAATLRFHDRMRDLDRRFDRWCDVDPVPMGEPA